MAQLLSHVENHMIYEYYPYIIIRNDQFIDLCLSIMTNVINGQGRSLD